MEMSVHKSSIIALDWYTENYRELRQFLATESPSKMMKNAFCFNSKVLSCSQDI